MLDMIFSPLALPALALIIVAAGWYRGYRRRKTMVVYSVKCVRCNNEVMLYGTVTGVCPLCSCRVAVAPPPPETPAPGSAMRPAPRRPGWAAGYNPMMIEDLDGRRRKVIYGWRDNDGAPRVVELDGVPDWLGALFEPVICQVCHARIDADCEDCQRTGVQFVPAHVAAEMPQDQRVGVEYLQARYAECQVRTGHVLGDGWTRLFGNFNGFEKNTPEIYRRVAKAVARPAATPAPPPVRTRGDGERPAVKTRDLLRGGPVDGEL